MSEVFSYSKLDTYNQCGFKYKLRYVDGHYVSGSSIATEFGTAIHEIEEAIANSIKANEPINYVALKNKFMLDCVKLQAKYPQDFQTLDKSNRTYFDKMYYYLNTGIFRLEAFMKEHPTYQIVGAEVAFNFAIDEEHGFKGFIDRLLFDTATNSYIVHDIKSYAIPVESSKLATPLQFVVYTLAVQNLFGCNPEQVSCAYDLPLCSLLQSAGTKGYMDRGLKKIQKLFDSIKCKDFAPAPTPLCAWCEFSPTNPNQPAAGKNLCPYYSLWTKENKTNKVAMHWEGLEAHDEVMAEYMATVGAYYEK